MPKQDIEIPTALKFGFGGTAGMMATCVVQPLDMIRLRMQISDGKTSPFQMTRNLIKSEGVGGLYSGLSAGLFRQATYTTARMGFYNYLLTQAEESNDGKPLGFVASAAIGSVAGGLGSIIGTPAEVSLVRMMADKSLPKTQQRGYTSVFDALARIVRDEGVLTLWRGCLPTVGRAMVLNAAQLSVYTTGKKVLKKNTNLKEGALLHFTAAMFAGVASTLVSMPFDRVKTKMQTMTADPKTGVLPYKNMVDCAVKTAASEGLLSFWRGGLVFWSRLGPHTTLTFMVLERMREMYRSSGEARIE